MIVSALRVYMIIAYPTNNLTCDVKVRLDPVSVRGGGVREMESLINISVGSRALVKCS